MLYQDNISHQFIFSFYKYLIMLDNNLTFKQKIKLYNDLKSFFQNADLKNHPMKKRNRWHY